MIPPMTETALPQGKPVERLLAWLLPTMPVLVFAFVFWTSLFFMPTMLNAGDGDLGRHLTVGSLILSSGQIPAHDVFSHTLTGAPLVPHEWLSEVLFALSYRLAGLNGVAWLTALILASAYAILAIALRRAGVRALVALVAVLFASMVGAVHMLLRPHIFTLLFFTILLLVLEEYRNADRRRALIVLLPLMVVWANMHGAFISGLMLVAFYAVGAALEKERRRLIELAALFVSLVVASWINPVGIQLLVHSFAYLGNRFLVNLTVEYQSPDFHAVNVLPFAALLLLSFAIVGRSGKRLDWTPLILLVGWSAFALYSTRNIPLYAQVAVIILAPIADAWIDELLPAAKRFLARTDEIDRVSSGWIWAVAVVALLVGLQMSGDKIDVRGTGNVFDPHVFPIAAVDSMTGSLPSGNMFNEFNWGGYLLYRLWPEKQVFIDGQQDFYGEALTREYLQAINAEPGWQAILDRYNVRWVIVSPTRALAARLDASPDWSRRYIDETAGVWVRR